jgi:hypothetical protein
MNKSGRLNALRYRIILTALLASALICASSVSFAEDVFEIYIYGYPLVTMDMTRRALANVAEVGPTRAPTGQLI